MNSRLALACMGSMRWRSKGAELVYCCSPCILSIKLRETLETVIGGAGPVESNSFICCHMLSRANRKPSYSMWLSAASDGRGVADSNKVSAKPDVRLHWPTAPTPAPIGVCAPLK
jgi:hypothetical protein